MENEKINWSAFEVQDENRIKIETNQKYEFGFYSITQGSLEVVDKERTEEGKVETKKTIPTLILGIDWLNGKPVRDKSVVITSKKLAKQIRMYFEKNLLFSKLFYFEKTGEGFQTQYILSATTDKRASGVETFV